MTLGLCICLLGDTDAAVVANIAIEFDITAG